ncbi:MAG: tetratricopeptide repeat protein [Lachnospiraceae bacterium]|nr:tetratricopeptide repeat protein [Lachnospiraceae bacterium]
MNCRNCGAEVQPDEKYCFSCGALLEGNAADAEIKKKSFPWVIAIVSSLIVIALIIFIVVWASGSTERKYDEQLKLAERYLDELDYDRAVAAYKAAIDIDPENPEAYLALADAYIEMGDYEEARKILEKGLKSTGDEEIEERLAEIEEMIFKTEKEQEIEQFPDPTPTPAPDYKSIYEAFLRGEKKAKVDKSSPSYDYGNMHSESGLTEYMPSYEMTFSEFLDAYKGYVEEEYYSMQGQCEIDLSKIRYAYADLGNNGSEELVIVFGHGWEKSVTGVEFFVREVNDSLEIFSMHESMGRGSCGISNRYGLFGGQASGGAALWMEETGFLDEEGQYNNIFYSDTRSDLAYYLTGELWGNETLVDGDAFLIQYSSPNVESKCFLHASGGQNTTIQDDWNVYYKYIDLFHQYGKELATPDTEEEYINSCFKASGCPDEVRNGPEIEWLNYSDL